MVELVQQLSEEVTAGEVFLKVGDILEVISTRVIRKERRRGEWRWVKV